MPGPPGALRQTQSSSAKDLAMQGKAAEHPIVFFAEETESLPVEQV